ncbi:hypothetical protein Plhal304r1_c072g0160371 [Plasmopara halstedii]
MLEQSTLHCGLIIVHTVRKTFITLTFHLYAFIMTSLGVLRVNVFLESLLRELNASVELCCCRREERRWLSSLLGSLPFGLRDRGGNSRNVFVKENRKVINSPLRILDMIMFSG